MDADRKTWEELSKQVFEATGRHLPPFEHIRAYAGSAEFERLMAELRDRHPALWRQVLDAATGSVELPVEREADMERRRRRVLSALFSVISRPDGLRTGRRRLNSMVLLTAGAAAILVASLFVQRDWQGAEAESDVARPPEAREVKGGVQQAAMAAGIPPRVTEAPPARHGTPAAGDAAALPPPPPAVPLAEPSPPEGVHPPEVPPPDGALPTVPGAGEASSPGRVQGGGEGRLKHLVAPGMLFRRQPTWKNSGALLFSRKEGGPVGQAGPVLHRSTGASWEASGSAMLFGRREDRLPGGAAVLFRKAEPSPGPAPGQGTSGGTPGGTPSPAPPAPLVHPGQLVSARLLVPVSVSPAWQDVPVLAEVADGQAKGLLLWGRARMAQDGSIEIAFHQVMDRSGNSVPWNAVAYDQSFGRIGLQGRTETVMPNMLQTLFSSALRAASEYFKAKIESKQVTVTNGFVTVRTGEPSFMDAYLKELSEAMTPRTPAGTGPVVVSRLPAGAVIKVLAMSPLHWHADKSIHGR